jgi:signal transduction histidine kinase
MEIVKRDASRQTAPSTEKRVVVLAPSGYDASVLCRVLEDAGVETTACETAAQLCRRVGEGAAAAIVADEALTDEAERCLVSMLADQPEWSDFPLIVMTTRHEETGRVWSLLERLNGSAHPLLLERPVSRATLVRAVRAVLQSRTRQYQIRDQIAERERLENELLLKVEELAESDRRKDGFLAVLGHELRSPLAAIVNGIQVLPMLGGLNQRAEEVCELLGRQAKLMTHLIDDLLDLSRIGRGSVRLRIERIDLVDLIREVAEEHQAACEESTLKLDLELPERLPVDGDPTRLRQILGNLLHNACKFTDPGGRVSIAARSDRERQIAIIEVRDTGIGMSEESLARLFEPFSQVEASLERSRGGLGLGLALVRGLVELHRGTVSAHSTGIGKGSEFIVTLPLGNEEIAAHDGSAAEVRPSSRRVFRILLVEDFEPIARIFSLILKQLGNDDVEIARSAAEALDRIPVFRPEIVVSDISMPGIDGYELARRIRCDAEWSALILVALTGYGQTEDRERAREAGFDYYLVKPADIEQMQALLDAIANRS